MKKEDEKKTDQGQHDLSQQLMAKGAEIDSVIMIKVIIRLH